MKQKCIDAGWKPVDITEHCSFLCKSKPHHRFPGITTIKGVVFYKDERLVFVRKDFANEMFEDFDYMQLCINHVVVDRLWVEKNIHLKGVNHNFDNGIKSSEDMIGVLQQYQPELATKLLSRRVLV